MENKNVNPEAIIELPSKGLFYDGIDAEIVFRTLDTGDEQKILGSSSNTALDSALSGTIIEPKGLDINDLIPGDKMFFMMQQRIHTYGSTYRQLAFCPMCEFDGHIDYSLEDIKCNVLPDGFKVPLKLKLPVNGDIITLNVHTAKQIKALKDRANKTSKTTGADYGEIYYFLSQAKNIGTVNGSNLDSYSAEKYVKELHPKDRAYISSAYKSVKLGYESTVEVMCPKCGKTILIPFQITDEFFTPFTEVTFL